MKYAKLFCFVASMTLFSANQAFAFTLTRRIRVPDWMDIYFAELLFALSISYFGVMVTKPRGVPFKQLAQVQISPLANFFRVLCLIMVWMLVLMFFAGMFLRRYAEFSARFAS
ncbi:hypothetical protein [Rhizobium sp. MHM7A]|uniref:hypothetical protein n=1 Tax=Rhizobium sp. MHM7A TaxID=2583233 RepID=UPI00110722F9|nr:hypothetical protein [Rhizobium sp. MHM7A]TLX16316.1 hypothetical protein FFR93_03020 [Rhizobium sp. MHM7A]